MANETAPSAAAVPIADAPVGAAPTADIAQAQPAMGAGDIPSPAPMAAAEVIPLPAEVAPVEAKPDPLAAVMARLDAQEKHNTDLRAQLAKLTAAPSKPEPAKEQPRTLTDSPFEAQARAYYGDLPKPLLTQATEVLERRHEWQQVLRAADTAVKAGDASAGARAAEASKWLGTIQQTLERIEFDAQMSRQLQAQQTQPVQGWGPAARETLIDDAISDRDNWGAAFKGLKDHEVAAVLRSVPAGESPEDYVARALKSLSVFAAERQPTQASAPAPQASPKNPAPSAPAKPEVGLTGPQWPTDRVMEKHEFMNHIISRARGDAQTN
jgi:hypothetical protein